MKQRFDNTGLEHPVGFFSRALSGSERNYAAYELKMYAVVQAVEHFRMFLLGLEFLLRTDHAALAKLLRRDLPPTIRVERWILRLSEYMFRIQHQRGIDNVIADVLSRLLFARGSVEDCTSSLSANTSNEKRGSTGSSSAVGQFESSTVGRPITGSEQHLVAEQIPMATVAANTVACVGLSSKDSCVTLQDAAESPSTTTLLAGTATMYSANANAIGKNLPTTTPASNEDPIRMIRNDYYAVGRSDSEILGGSTFILQAGTTASQAGTTAVFANFPTDNGIGATGNQTPMIPADRGCEINRFKGLNQRKQSQLGTFRAAVLRLRRSVRALGLPLWTALSARRFRIFAIFFLESIQNLLENRIMTRSRTQVVRNSNARVTLKIQMHTACCTMF